MTRPKNTVTITKANKEGTMYDIWYDAEHGRVKWGRRSTTTILKALQHYEKCPLTEDIT